MMNRGRHTASFEGDLVVFLIGARVHKLWKVRKWWPVAKAMGGMQREIAAHPEIGCLHVQNFGAVNGVSVQYWKSFQHLEEFARSSKWSHLPAWRDFNRLIRDSGDLGIWHETYMVPAGGFEAMYGNMPAMGLAAAGSMVPVGAGSTASRRAGVDSGDVAPVPGY